jgi:competence protein ComEC
MLCTQSDALWRRTISERNFRYLAANQGMDITIGMFVSLQILWPVRPLHKGSNEVRDNGLIVRVVTPGLRLLLLGASAQSKYALTGLLNDVATPYLQADVVQIVDEAGTAEELNTVLQRSHPTVLLMTPTSAKQRKGGKQVQPSALALKNTVGWNAAQVIRTAQEGTVTLSSDQSGWSINIV